MEKMDPIRALLIEIYGEDAGRKAAERVVPLIDRAGVRAPAAAERFSEKDVILITYGDSLLEDGVPPLRSLGGFAAEWFDSVFSAIHILPFYPWSSDDGFSVVDFFAVDPALGRWTDVQAMKPRFGLMFDFVLNHISSRSRWFTKYLAEEAGWTDLSIEVDPAADLSRVVRPRALPLLTPFTTASGRRVHVWTTFSEDQIDLNYRSLEVLENMVRVFLHYVAKGADVLRMDAVAYLWKEIGTSCIHLPQTHAMVKLFRSILDRVAPQVMIITETNVPHPENVSYFGAGGDEAQLVYNFTLPPLLLHAFVRGDASMLSGWARQLVLESPQNSFFNFTASHDGIGVRPLEGILPAPEISFLIERVQRGGGQVSSKADADGRKSPYEMNITYVDAMRDPTLAVDPLHAARFLASQAAALVLPGVPGVYIHSILGSRNWTEGVARTGRARTINREKLEIQKVREELADPTSLRAKIFFPYREMIRIRRAHPVFHPNAGFAVVDIDPRLFAVRRTSGDRSLLAVTNVSGLPVAFSPPSAEEAGEKRDLITGRRVLPGETVKLPPYGVAWMLTETPASSPL